MFANAFIRGEIFSFLAAGLFPPTNNFVQRESEIVVRTQIPKSREPRLRRQKCLKNSGRSQNLQTWRILDQ